MPIIFDEISAEIMAPQREDGDAAATVAAPLRPERDNPERIVRQLALAAERERRLIAD